MSSRAVALPEPTYNFWVTGSRWASRSQAQQDEGDYQEEQQTLAANKERLDLALVRRGLAPSRERARALIMAGQVYLGDRLADKPGMLVPLDAELPFRGK